MLKPQNKHAIYGFSLIEVMMVLAISAGLIVIALATFSSRHRVASDDAAEQIASSVQAVRNEAQNGLGPTNNASFGHNETFYGEAIRFSNGANCNNSEPCMIVYKLKANPNSTNFSSYEDYQIPNPNGVEYYNPLPESAQNCVPSGNFQSCITATTYSTITTREYLLIIKNGSGSMAYYSLSNGNCLASGTGCATNPVNFAPVQGKLRQALLYREVGSANNTGSSDSQVPGGNDYQYYLNVDMDGGGSITTSRP